jgi:uncharacterized RDD family membrane protein YckC
MSDGLFLAGRFRRLVATLIDAVLVPSLTLVLVMIAGVVEDAEDYVDNQWFVWVLLLAVVSYLLLNGYGLWRRGQTLGKQVMGVAIVPAAGVSDGQYGRTPAPLWKLICVRALFFPLLFLSVVPWIAALPIIDQLLIFLKSRRCLHDLVCGTVVVRLSSR